MRENRGVGAMAVSAPLTPAILPLDRNTLSSIAESRANLAFQPQRQIDNGAFVVSSIPISHTSTTNISLLSPNSTTSTGSCANSSSPSSSVYSGADGSRTTSDSDPSSSGSEAFRTLDRGSNPHSPDGGGSHSDESPDDEIMTETPIVESKQEIRLPEAGVDLAGTPRPRTTSPEDDADEGSVSSPDDVPRDPDWAEERFRVDRKKLEALLSSDATARIQQGLFGLPETGAAFFQSIMEATGTTITWPSKLKIGAKSKKDPHIKVTGKRDLVERAKEEIVSKLDTKSQRTTLKMDVSFTDHSHVIGKGGNNIKKVMEETGCHIHFPDSNRANSGGEKSNQVSIAGHVEGVEAARKAIRRLLPLVLAFDLQVGVSSRGIVVPTVDVNNPLIQRIQQMYNIAVMIKPKTSSIPPSTTFFIRGTVDNEQNVIQATRGLIDCLTASFGGNALVRPSLVSTQMEISPQHHTFIQGKNELLVKQITQRTGVSIIFPDGTSTSAIAPLMGGGGSPELQLAWQTALLQAGLPSPGASSSSSAPNGASRKSSVLICGAKVENVVLARSMLIGCLPLVLMFDMKDDSNSVDAAQIAHYMETLDVFISVKPKPKQPSKSVIVKSMESNYSNVYEARRLLLSVGSCNKKNMNNLANAKASLESAQSMALASTYSASFIGDTAAMLERQLQQQHLAAAAAIHIMQPHQQIALAPTDAKNPNLPYCSMTCPSSRSQPSQSQQQLHQKQQQQIQKQYLQQSQSVAIASAAPNGMRNLTSLTISVPPSSHPPLVRPSPSSCHGLNAASTHPHPSHLDSPTLLAPTSPRGGDAVVSAAPILQITSASAAAGKSMDDYALATQQRHIQQLQQQQIRSRPRTCSEAGLLLQYRGLQSGGVSCPLIAASCDGKGASLNTTAPSSSVNDSPYLADPTASKSAQHQRQQQQQQPPHPTIPPLMAPPPMRPQTASNFTHPVLTGFHNKPPPVSDRASQGSSSQASHPPVTQQSAAVAADLPGTSKPSQRQISTNQHGDGSASKSTEAPSTGHPQSQLQSQSKIASVCYEAASRTERAEVAISPAVHHTKMTSVSPSTNFTSVEKNVADSADQGATDGSNGAGSVNSASRFVSPSNSGSSADLLVLRAAACAATGSAMTESSGGLGGIVGEKMLDVKVGGLSSDVHGREVDKRAPGYERRHVNVTSSATGNDDWNSRTYTGVNGSSVGQTTDPLAELSEEPDQGDIPDCFASDYEEKKLRATKAMAKRPTGAESRRPTDMWSGLGFSKSMPENAIRDVMCVRGRLIPTQHEPTLAETDEEEAQVTITLHNSDDRLAEEQRRYGYADASANVQHQMLLQQQLQDVAIQQQLQPDMREKDGKEAPDEKGATPRFYDLSISNYIDSSSLPKSIWSNFGGAPARISRDDNAEFKTDEDSREVHSKPTTMGRQAASGRPPLPPTNHRTDGHSHGNGGRNGASATAPPKPPGSSAQLQQLQVVQHAQQQLQQQQQIQQQQRASTNSSPECKLDLPDLFSSYGLGKYTDLFQQQEIDLTTFLTLTEEDLRNLGISTFGARRKMLIAIAELNARTSNHVLQAHQQRVASVATAEASSDASVTDRPYGSELTANAMTSQHLQRMASSTLPHVASTSCNGGSSGHNAHASSSNHLTGSYGHQNSGSHGLGTHQGNGSQALAPSSQYPPFLSSSAQRFSQRILGNAKGSKATHSSASSPSSSYTGSDAPPLVTLPLHSQNRSPSASFTEGASSHHHQQRSSAASILGAALSASLNGASIASGGAAAGGANHSRLRRGGHLSPNSLPPPPGFNASSNNFSLSAGSEQNSNRNGNNAVESPTTTPSTSSLFGGVGASAFGSSAFCFAAPPPPHPDDDDGRELPASAAASGPGTRQPSALSRPHAPVASSASVPPSPPPTAFASSSASSSSAFFSTSSSRLHDPSPPPAKNQIQGGPADGNALTHGGTSRPFTGSFSGRW